MADPQPTDLPQQPRPARSGCFWDLALIGFIVLLSTTGPLWSTLQFLLRGPEAPAGVGRPLPLLELTPLTGNPPQLASADLQGHVTLLNFWGPWCPPCREELPHIAKLRERFAGQEVFRLVAVSYPSGGRAGDPQSLRDDTNALLKRLGLDLPTHYDPGNVTLTAVDQMIGFQGFPTTLLLDRHGAIRAIWSGYRPGTETEIETYVDKVLSEAEGEKERQETKKGKEPQMNTDGRRLREN